jgi:DNA-binding LacI/PurR family transcriptional regulator
MNNKKQNRKKLTLKDVADSLSLTPATVSKALRDGSDISLETRERVKKACRELGYRPNLLARSLISNRSRILGVIVPDLRISFFSEAVRGMYEEASIKGYECILLAHDEDADKERKKIEFLSDLGVDGILLNSAGGKKNFELYKSIFEEGIKIVCWDRKLDELKFKSVIINDISASYNLTEEMIKKGRKNILFLGPHRGIPVCRDRFNGYKMALQKYKIPYRPELVLETFRDVDDSYKKMSTFLDKKIKIDGMVSVGGLNTFGAGKAILDHKLTIPKDVVIGEFGDNDVVYRLGVPFYTVNQNPYKIGKASVDLLVKIIDTKEDEDKFQDIIIESELLQR